VLLFAISTLLAWLFGNDPRKLVLAKRLVLIDGIGVASAGIWLACHTSGLPPARLVVFIAACLGAIGFCLHCWSVATVAAPGTRAASSRPTKPALGIGIAIVLAAASLTAMIDHYRLRPFDEPYWARDIFTLANVPTVALRPSTTKNTGITGSSARITARGVSLSALLAYAYGTPSAAFQWSGHRVVLPAGVADGKFDFILATPDRNKKALQEEIQKQLGLVAHRELREVDALALMVPNSNALELPATNGGDSSDNRGMGSFTFANQPIGDLSDAIEDDLGRPVINGTELIEKYSGSLKWNHQPDAAAELRELQSSLSAQFGLALVPSHEPVEMLVVEKAP
jgi:uncharacterized protein (TIGR03435 family)